MSPTAKIPAFSRLIFELQGFFVAGHAAILLLLWLLVVAYVGGPRLRSFSNSIFGGFADRLAYALPWKRMRAQRDFSAALGLLLEAGVPEPDALSLAAEAGGNRCLARKIARVKQSLQSGVRLPEALSFLDKGGELQWRLSNAFAGGKGFGTALKGWYDALDAKAFQMEQTAAQALTTVLVLMNGFLVAGYVIAVFLGLINLIEDAVLW
jgi:type II secretory pathway component PulF